MPTKISSAPSHVDSSVIMWQLNHRLTLASWLEEGGAQTHFALSVSVVFFYGVNAKPVIKLTQHGAQSFKALRRMEEHEGRKEGRKKKAIT